MVVCTPLPFVRKRGSFSKAAALPTELRTHRNQMLILPSGLAGLVGRDAGFSLAGCSNLGLPRSASADAAIAFSSLSSPSLTGAWVSGRGRRLLGGGVTNPIRIVVLLMTYPPGRITGTSKSVEPSWLTRKLRKAIARRCLVFLFISALLLEVLLHRRLLRGRRRNSGGGGWNWCCQSREALGSKAFPSALRLLCSVFKPATFAQKELDLVGALGSFDAGAETVVFLHGFNE